MENKTLEQQLSELKAELEKSVSEKTKSELKSQFEAIEKQVKDLEGKIDTKEIQKGIDEMKKSFDTISQWQVKKDEADKANQEVIDATASFLKEQKNRRVADFGLNAVEAIHKAITDKKDELKGYKKDKRAIHIPVEGFNVKSVGNMADGNFTVSGTQGFLTPQPLPGVGRKNYEAIHVRDILSVIPRAEGDTMPMVRDNSGEGAPTAVAKGGAKPQSDRDYVKLIVPITKVAHHYRIPEEWLEDAAWLAGEITSVGIEELLVVEDDLILNNTTSGEFQGLTTATNSTAYSLPSGMAAATNNYEYLVAALTQLRNLKVQTANGILINPSDYAAMILEKGTTNDHYLFGAPGISVPNVWGVPLIPHTAVTADKFLLGDFRQVVLGQRAALSVRFYEQDQDNAIKNMVTVVIEERIAVAARRADKLIYGDFGNQS